MLEWGKNILVLDNPFVGEVYIIKYHAMTNRSRILFKFLYDRVK